MMYMLVTCHIKSPTSSVYVEDMEQEGKVLQLAVVAFNKHKILLK